MTGDDDYSIEPIPNDSLDDNQPRPSPQDPEGLDTGKVRWPRPRPLHRIRSGRVNRQKRGSARPSG